MHREGCLLSPGSDTDGTPGHASFDLRLPEWGPDEKGPPGSNQGRGTYPPETESTVDTDSEEGGLRKEEILTVWT